MRWLSLLAAVALAACGQAAAPASAPSQGGWEQTLAAAKQEGKVSLITPPGDGTRAALTEGFEKTYGISVDTVSASGSQAVTRVMGERDAGKFLWDVYVNGVTEVLTTFIPAHAVDPIEPVLMLPEVTDPKSWRDGGIEYVDKDHMLVATTRTVYPTVWLNPKLAKPEQLKSFKDFLDPAWKVKLVIDDPRKPGPGQALLTEWYLTPDLGPDFIREFAKQQPLILTDYAQEANMVGQGQYAALLGGSDQTLDQLIKKGVPIVVVPPRQLKEPPQVAAGATAMAMFNRAPHPNAAKLYVNWLLSKDGQAGFARSQAAVSNRLDVPTDYLDAWRVPSAGAIKTYGPDALAVRDKVIALAKELFPQ
ncbi:MAG TPA: extracellular solute-binding protein [Chloroflexota bacterium]